MTIVTMWIIIKRYAWVSGIVGLIQNNNHYVIMNTNCSSTGENKKGTRKVLENSTSLTPPYLTSS